MIWKEEIVEDNIDATLSELGYKKYNEKFNKDNMQEVIDDNKLRHSLEKINPKLDIEYIELAIKELKKCNYSNIIEGNYHCLKFIKNGVPIKINNKENGRTLNVKLIDFSNIENNEFNFIRQMDICDSKNVKLIPDIIVYVNGIPLSILELKAPEANDKLEDAYNQLINYSNRKPILGYLNIFAIVSNGFTTRYGSLTSPFERWNSWKQESIYSKIEQDIDYDISYDKCLLNYQKNIRGLFNRENFLNIIKNYCFFQKKENSYIKIISLYYQYFCVEKAILSIKNAKYGQGGVVWHTQGSGKSVSMLFLAKRIKDYFPDKKYKLIYVTDRKELDEQLYKRFCDSAEDYLYLTPRKMNSREELKKTLSNDKEFGIYFTTIQKFDDTIELLSDKDDIIVIADEAHRSHNNIDSEIDYSKKNKKLYEKKGFALFLREAFPNATFIGFTGTPLMGSKKQTVDVFGDYIDKYLMEQAILDGSTVPIHYEKRKIEIIADKVGLDELDELYKQEMEEMDFEESDYLKNAYESNIQNKLIRIENLLNDKDVIHTLVSDFWKHYDIRSKNLNGKAMFVGYKRNVAWNIYKEMIKQRPEFKDSIKLIITSSNKDTKEMIDDIPNDSETKEIANEFKKDTSKIKIVVVVDMWLTGFDVPDLDTIYLFKVIKWHNLMQTIARVNRTYSDGKDKVKKDGLVVDYIGIWKYISEALKQYSSSQELEKDKYDIEYSKALLLDILDEINKGFFGKNNDVINKWINLEMDKKDLALDSGIEIILSKNKDEKDLFFAKVSNVKRLYKLCNQILDDKDRLESQFYIFIKRLIRTNSIDDSISTKKMLEKLKEKMSQIVKTGDIEVATIALEGRKDLSYISKILEKEIKLFEQNKKVSNLKIKEMCSQLNADIKEFSRTNPILSNELSKQLVNLINKLDDDKDFEQFFDEFQKIIIKMNDAYKNNEFIGEDEYMQALYSILSDETFKIQHAYNSELIKNIVYDIYSIIEKNITPQWWYNKRLQALMNMQIKTLLRNTYNYPPDKSDNATSLLIKELREFICRNPEKYLRKDQYKVLWRM